MRNAQLNCTVRSTALLVLATVTACATASLACSPTVAPLELEESPTADVAFARGDCSFDSAAISQLGAPEQCAVRALSETCDDRHRCHASCLVDGSGNVGGGCAHVCGLIELSHPYYDCYPGSREHIDAMGRNFVIVNDSIEEIRVELHFETAANHRFGERPGCLEIDVRLAPKDQLGEDAYLVDDQGRLLVRPVEPRLEGTASRCTAAVEIPPSEILLYDTSYGYWFTEIARVDVRTSAGSYTFSHADVPHFDAPAESVFRWHVWRHPPPAEP